MKNRLTNLNICRATFIIGNNNEWFLPFPVGFSSIIKLFHRRVYSMLKSFLQFPVGSGQASSTSQLVVANVNQIGSMGEIYLYLFVPISKSLIWLHVISITQVIQHSKVSLQKLQLWNWPFPVIWHSNWKLTKTSWLVIIISGSILKILATNHGNKDWKFERFQLVLIWQSDP